MRLKSAVLATLMVCALPATRAAAIDNAAARLTAQDATYALHLDRARGNVVGAVGSMTYKVDDLCHAWASQQRLEMTLTNSDGTDVKTVSDYATWESKDGTRMNFHLRQTTDGAVTAEVDSTAALKQLGGPGEIHYTAPEVKVMALPTGTLFPSTHTAMIIAAAEAGQHFVAVPLFDGTGPDGAQDTFVLAEGWDPPRPDRFAALAKQSSGQVHVAFFTRTPSALMPDYEVGMRYWQGGVADGLRMDFGDFVMDGKLEKLSVPPAPHC